MFDDVFVASNMMGGHVFLIFLLEPTPWLLLVWSIWDRTARQPVGLLRWALNW